MYKVYYLSEFDFSNDNASTNRIIYNALSLTAKGKYSVTILGCSNLPFIIKNGFDIGNVKIGKGFLQKKINYLFRGFLFIHLIRKFYSKPHFLIYYGTFSRMILPLLVYCKINKIKIITDIAEWYEYANLPMGRYGIFALDVHLGITKFISKCDGVIVISSYLEKYYRKKRMNIIHIPVTLDTSEYKPNEIIVKFDCNFLNLIYAGTPGKKDLILNIIDAVVDLNIQNIPIKLHIIGPMEEINKFLPTSYENGIVYYGNIPHWQVVSYLRQADFSVLLRPNMRYANAGFPTKFVESLNAGLPVIANYTSDLSKYLIDGKNGFVVKDPSSSELKNILLGIMRLKKSQLNEMRQNAKLTAKQNFDYLNFVDVLDDFLTSFIL